MDKAIILYTISDDDLRACFAEALESLGFENHPDQSTYTCPLDKVGETFDIAGFTSWLEKWSRNKAWSETDFVDVYYLDYIKASKFAAIKSISFRRNS